MLSNTMNYSTTPISAMYCSSLPLDANMNFTVTTTSDTSGPGNISQPTLDGRYSSQSPPVNLTSWNYWQDMYYPQVIRQSYPVYIQERAKDNGQKAFEVIKLLHQKKLLKLDTVGDFINAMDALIKTL